MIIVLAEIDRNRPRKELCPPSMYYGNGGWITAPFNLAISNSVIRKTDNDPFLSMEANFPRHNELKRQWKRIRDEVLKIYSEGLMSEIRGDLFFQKIADKKWKKFYIKWYGPSLKEAKEKLPFTTNLIDSFPEIKLAMISVLEPGSIIPPHIGPSRASLRYHLGLVTPKDKENCWIKVDGEKYSWKDGEDVLFDDTYVHEVQNNTKGLRVILFCDIQRSLNNPVSNKICEFVCHVAGVTSREN